MAFNLENKISDLEHITQTVKQWDLKNEYVNPAYEVDIYGKHTSTFQLELEQLESEKILQ